LIEQNDQADTTVKKLSTLMSDAQFISSGTAERVGQSKAKQSCNKNMRRPMPLYTRQMCTIKIMKLKLIISEL